MTSSWTQSLQRAGVPQRLAGALLRYRIMAWVTGVALLALCASMILRYVFHVAESSVAVVAPIHGYLYIVYLVTVVHLGLIKQRWPLVQVVLVMLAGTIPVMSFIFERRISHKLEHSAIREAEATATA